MIKKAICSVLQNSVVETEIIVVDGGSEDETVELATTHARTISGPRGRGEQMNLGAAHVGGDVLVFLHADTQLHAGYLSEMLRTLADPTVAGGCAPIIFDVPHRILSLYSWFSRTRFRFFHFGDGAIFVRRNVFEQLGGFHSIPIMEDLDFLRRMRRTGKVVLLTNPVLTSSRRFVRRGIVINQLCNIILVVLFLFGVSPHYLARWYPDERK